MSTSEHLGHTFTIALFSLYVLFSYYRSCDNTLENCFFQISSHSRVYLRITYKTTDGQVPLARLLGKENIKAKEVYLQRRSSGGVDYSGDHTRKEGLKHALQ